MVNETLRMSYDPNVRNLMRICVSESCGDNLKYTDTGTIVKKTLLSTAPGGRELINKN